MSSKRTKALDISSAVRTKVRERDGGCIFCTKYNFLPTGANTEIMHYIGRGAGGLGIPENLAVGCIIHHRQMDQGTGKQKLMMKALMRDYLRNQYPEWDESKLTWTHDMNYEV